MRKITSILLAVLLALSLLAGCGNQGAETPIQSELPAQTQAEEIKIPPVMGDDITPTDYAKKENWMKLPETDYAVDVFYLYPTAWTRGENEPYYCEIDNQSMVEGANLIYKAQATAYEPVANVYAPYYRQLDAVWLLDEPLPEQEKYFTGVPYADAVAAFEYYLENYNQGKPFILAGHSQGSSVTKSIVKYYMKDHPEVYEKMVAAYVIGYYVSEDELKENPHMKFAQRADDTGVIVSWNVEAPETTENPLAPKGSISINPITWTLGEETATKEQNLGSAVFNRQAQTITPMEHLADATINQERGTVICSTVDIETYAPGGTGLFPRGVYHSQDYGFYFENIRENAKTRIESFLNQ